LTSAEDFLFMGTGLSGALVNQDVVSCIRIAQLPERCRINKPEMTPDKLGEGVLRTLADVSLH
jgi:hypothetical protein